jgi:hypothetical protein
VRVVPDSQDYAELDRLLRDPHSWTPNEANFMRSLLTNQREAAEAWHPKDASRRSEMTALADDIEAAIRRYETR